MRSVIGSLGLALPLLVASSCGIGGGGEEFCDEGGEALATFWTLDPSPENDEFSEVVGVLEELDPPDEIAADWEPVVELLVRVRDLEAPQPEDLEEVLAPVAALDDEIRRIQAYVSEECGVEMGQ